MVDSNAQVGSQNPLALASCLLVEFSHLTGVEPVLTHFGSTNFVDVTSEALSAGEWTSLDLTTLDAPRLFAFVAKECNGELEFIFSGGRLVQTGFLLVGDPAQAPFLARLFDAIAAILTLRAHTSPVSPTHLVFSDNLVNGYVRIPEPGRLAFRLSDLSWCEKRYGPLQRRPLYDR